MLSKQSIDILIDLVEIKLSSMIVQDKEDMREVKKLRICRSELITLSKLANRQAIQEENLVPESNLGNQFL